MYEIYDKIIYLKKKYNSNIVFNSKNIKPNDIFIGIGNGKNNGSLYFDDALKRGALLLIINHKRAIHKNIIQIKDIQNFINNFCKYLLSIYKGKIISITGSVGKTTIKENLYHVLTKNKFLISKSYKNFNNKLGLQFSIMNINLKSEFSIFELGINKSGEMDVLIKILNPHYCLITCIEDSHIGRFDNFNSLVKNKIKIFDSKNLIKGLINFRYSKPKIKKKINSKITHINIDNIQKKIIKKNPFQINFSLNNKDYKIKSDLDDIYIETAILTFLFLKNFINKKLNSKYFYKNAILSNRGKIISRKFKNKLLKIHDHSYNSSPYSLKKQLISFDNKKLNKKLCIIGSMKELGSRTNYYHKEIINLVSTLNFDKTILIGTEFYKLKKHNKSFKFYKTTQSYIKYMMSDLSIHNNIFIMGSRYYRLESIIDKIC